MRTPTLVTRCITARSSSKVWQDFQKRFDPWIQKYVKLAWKESKQEYDRDAVALVVADVYISLFRSKRQALREFQGDCHEKFLAYLSRICINAVREHLRKQLTQKRKVELVTFESAHTRRTFEYLSVNPEPEIISDIYTRQLLRQLDSIASPRDREIFMRFVFEGFSSSELGQQYDIKPSSVESIIRRLREKFYAKVA